MATAQADKSIPTQAHSQISLAAAEAPSIKISTHGKSFLTGLISSTRIGQPVLMMDVKVSKSKTLADGLIKRTSSMLDETESKTMLKDKEGNW